MNLEKNLKGALEKIDTEVLETYEQKLRRINSQSNTSSSKDFVVFPSANEDPIDGPVTIIPVSDIHLGNKNCNVRKLAQILQLILETPNCYTILLGDQLEAATKTSIGMSVFDESDHLREQVKLLTRLLRPLANAGKILGVINGNHEMRIPYATSLNPIEMIAESLNIEYFGFQAYISLRVGSQVYNIFGHHGTGGGSTPGGKLNAMRRLNRVALADIYLSGHTHGRMYDHDVLMTFNHEELKMEPMIRHYLVCGSFLDYWDGYAEMKLLPVATTGVVSFTLSPHEKHVQVML